MRTRLVCTVVFINKHKLNLKIFEKYNVATYQRFLLFNLLHYFYYFSDTDDWDIITEYSSPFTFLILPFFTRMQGDILSLILAPKHVRSSYIHV